MKSSRMIRNGFLGLLGLVFSAAVSAHGGAAGTDTDQCKFELEKDHWIHYTAYQPKAYPAEEFCGNIPDTGSLTQLVFDYQDQRYRGMAVEFEVTKEPEGKRVFFQGAEKHKSGTVVLNLPEGVPEVGKYLIHITLLQDNGERLDAHMSFKAGGGQPTSKSSYGLYALVLFAGLYIFYLSNAGFKSKVDGMLGKAKEL
ncbi:MULTISPECIES: hypothetical protein [Methylomonas]|uniref:Uncharacterized protein n=1 Tax=Methylomonas koyamae TaxID=702114 RepID=A0A291IPB2_9GAMM|nr:MULTISPECIES: hypothetical protein [Methylomonas]ANE57072.1 hypothetical protein AYM39_19095 [Methylomonas sp. DH-1]ATG92046.1 hypothetical protein MKLM6_3867 [Methylomonas koyamae]OAI25427.1 hypothetical protein A1356_13235 [Methylomonas koyamae]WNB75491.1 hypothetical protein RI210_19770 [Methylomonas koyamae]BBL60275.1 hypothetical protein MKFW12EY_38880 [Methylomonas koyamae]